MYKHIILQKESSKFAHDIFSVQNITFVILSALFVIVNNVSGFDHLCGLVVRVPGHRSRGPGSIPGAPKFSEK
jgi:hypothetical protein